MKETKGNVLVVDDEEPIRDIVSRVLGAEGFTCFVAADGREALEKTATQAFDVVLLDIMMPDMSGMEVLHHLTTANPDACVVMTTAVDDVQTAVEALNLGAVDYVTKPFNLDDLGKRVEEAVELARQTSGRGDR